MAYLMIVDDDEDFAESAATALRSAGHEVRIVLDTDGAVQSMQERHPDLVILDVMFPEDTSAGFQLARTMRHYIEELKDIPVLMVTAVNARFPLGFSGRDVDDTWLPVSEFLEKPVDIEVLKERVAELVGTAGQAGQES